MQPEDRLDALLARDLAGMPWPGIRSGDEALEPLLAAAAALGPLREARPSAAFTAVLEERLLALAATSRATSADDAVHNGHLAMAPTAPTISSMPAAPEQPTAVPRARSPRRAHPARRTRFLWPAVAAAVLLLAFGTLTVAASAGPGSPLYGLHRLEQNVHVALSGNPADRMRLHLSYARDALTAANAAARAGNNATFADALATLRSELAAASTEMPNVPPGSDYNALATQLASLRSDAISGLWSDLPSLNWQNRLAATDALAAFGSEVPRVASATTQRTQDPSSHAWHVVITGSGFTPGARLLVNGRPAGVVTAVTATTLTADYTASDGRPPTTLGVANPDFTAAQTEHVFIVPPGPTNIPGTGSGGDHGSGSGKGGHGGGHGTPTPTPKPGS